jgi:hypothetical protein
LWTAAQCGHHLGCFTDGQQQTNSIGLRPLQRSDDNCRVNGQSRGTRPDPCHRSSSHGLEHSLRLSGTGLCAVVHQNNSAAGFRPPLQTHRGSHVPISGTSLHICCERLARGSTTLCQGVTTSAYGDHRKARSVDDGLDTFIDIGISAADQSEH